MKPTPEELVKKYIRLVYYYAKRWLTNENDIDDIVQETFKKALMKYNAFIYQNDGQLKAWLLIICRNTVFDQAKIQKPLALKDEIEIVDSEVDTFLDQEIAKEEIKMLKKSLISLEANDYEVIRLRYFEEIPFKDIAAILKITETGAKMRCYRALNKLRKEFTKWN